MAKKEEKKIKPRSRPSKREKVDLAERRPYDIWTDVDQMFNRFRSDIDDLFWSPYRGVPATWDEFNVPTTDIADRGDTYEVNAELPGVSKEDINIEVTPSSIEISTEKQASDEDEQKNWVRRERRSMSYYRHFDLPEDIKSDQVEAELRDGVLNVMLPKVEPKPKHESKRVNIK